MFVHGPATARHPNPSLVIADGARRRPSQRSPERSPLLAPPMRYPLFLLARAALLLGGIPLALGAQTATTQTASALRADATATASVTAASMQPPCNYTDCALRIEPSFGGPRLVRGTAGNTAARLGPLRPAELAELFAGSDSASAYGRRYVRAERVNRLLTLSGAVLGAVGLAQTSRMNGLTITGVALFTGGIPYQAAAQRNLSRAVWWYNASLPNAPPARE
jgi:hypothetical protein